MIMYSLYRIGHFLAMHLPVSITYALASLIGRTCFIVLRKERDAILSNLRVIMGPETSERELKKRAVRVFINFAKYLVDFFRSSLVDEEYIRKHVTLQGMQNIDKGLSEGKGVIALSAHIGNWELGGLVLSILRPPIGAIVLTHKNKKINDFFKRQRSVKDLKPLEIGPSLRSCFSILKNNGLLAVLGDRDFSNNGLYTNFFGKPTFIPKGPAVFSLRLGSCIVPVFMIREGNERYRMIFEKPIHPTESHDETSRVKDIMIKYTGIIQNYVKKYPDQWYMFREVWGENGIKNMRSDTIV